MGDSGFLLDQKTCFLKQSFFRHLLLFLRFVLIIILAPPPLHGPMFTFCLENFLHHCCFVYRELSSLDLVWQWDQGFPYHSPRPPDLRIGHQSFVIFCPPIYTCFLNFLRLFSPCLSDYLAMHSRRHLERAPHLENFLTATYQFQD